MKKQGYLAAPVNVSPNRLRPVSKHARGRDPKIAMGQAVNPGFAPGAFKKRVAKALAKEALISSSSAEARRIAHEKALAKAWQNFRADLSPTELAFAKEHRVHSQACDSHQRRSDKKNGLEFSDPADLPDSLGCGTHNGRKVVNRGPHPVDLIEPRQFAVQVEGLNDAEIKRLSETFGYLLRWALDDADLVQRGRRAIVITAAMRPDLAAGMKIDYDLANDLIDEVDSDPGEIHAAGAVYGSFLEWLGRGSTLSMFGERLDMTAYMLRPDLLPQNTLAKLGAILNKSRQAKDKLANCLRDTIGVKSMAMRPEITRDRCRDAQLA